ncbi:hypothetical protein U1Q18_033819, partial [Sarracenia purpurea var. burkii]
MDFGCLWNEIFAAEREVFLLWNELLWGAMWNFGFHDAKRNFGILCSASPLLCHCMNWSPHCRLLLVSSSSVKARVAAVPPSHV